MIDVRYLKRVNLWQMGYHKSYLRSLSFIQDKSQKTAIIKGEY